MKISLDDSAVRVLLVAVVVVTAIATHWIDRSNATARLVLTEMPDAGKEMTRAAQWLNDYYASSEGLQRPNGMWIDGHPDYVAIGAWLFDAYLRARLSGATEQEARTAVVQAIQQSDEWQVKHSAAAPGR